MRCDAHGYGMASLWQQGRRRLPTLLPPAPAPAPALQETGSCHSSCCFAHGIGALRPEGPGHLAHIEGECQRLLAGPSVRSRAAVTGGGNSLPLSPGPPAPPMLPAMLADTLCLRSARRRVRSCSPSLTRAAREMSCRGRVSVKIMVHVGKEPWVMWQSNGWRFKLGF